MDEVKSSEKWKSGLPESGSADFQNINALNNTDLNDTENNYTSSSSLYSTEGNEEEEEIGSEKTDWACFLRTEIDYEILTKEFPKEKNLIDKFIEIMVGIIECEDENIRVNSKYKPKKVVIGQLMKIKADNIRNVIQKFREFKKIGKPMSENYILTCLYNSVNVYNVDKSGKENTGNVDTFSPVFKTNFNNFQEHDYDFSELEKRFIRN